MMAERAGVYLDYSKKPHHRPDDGTSP
jgi:hypothetical protein